ncbi:hypothetical protein COOONC_07106 [Cooperia oncophora]
MSGFKPERLQLILQQLLLSQKAGEDVEGALSEIRKIVDEASPSSSLPDLELASGVATIYAALRFGMKSSIASDKWIRDRVAYATTVHSCFRGLHDRRSISQLGKIVKFQHVSSLLSYMLSNMEGDSVSLFRLLEATYDLCSIIFWSEEMKKEFLAMKSVGLYGKVVSVCLEVALNNENDLECR